MKPVPFVWMMIVAAVVLGGRSPTSSAQPPVDPLAEYGGAPVYATWQALTRAKWCLTNEQRYAEVVKLHPDAAPRLLAFVNDKVTTKLNTSVAFLAVDVSGKRGLWMMTNASTGRPDETKWGDETRAVAILLDKFLDAQYAVALDAHSIRKGATSVQTALDRISSAQWSPYASTDDLADLVEAFSSYSRTGEGKRALRALRTQDEQLYREADRLAKLTSGDIEKVRRGQLLDAFNPGPRPPRPPRPPAPPP